MKFVFTCGGTGGHIYPALAAAQRLRELMPDCGILFVGVEGNMETELVPRSGFEIRTVRAGNLHRSLRPSAVAHNIRSGVNVAGAIVSAKRILKEFRPDAVIGTGGYVCFPVLCAASALSLPTLMHEANAFPGLTTRMLEKRTDRLMVAFEESRDYYRHPERVSCVGMPVRSEFRDCDRAEARKKLGLSEEERLVLSFGGSLGASSLNRAVAEMSPVLEAEGAFRLLHASGGGESGAETLLGMLRERGVPDPKMISVRPYLYDMKTAMAAADLVVCRSGASTLGELAASGRAAILIPYPHATGNHQEKNALVAVGRGAAIMIRDPECTGERLYAEITALLDRPETLREMNGAMRGMDKENALDGIVDEILKCTGKANGV